MNKSFFGLLTLLFAGCACLFASDDAVRMLTTAPLRFEPSGSGYVTRGLEFSSSLHGDHMDLRSKDKAMRLTFAQASPSVQLEAGDPLDSRSNVIHGNDRSKWRTVPNYANLHARGLYRGIDLVYYGNHGELEYDLIVKPGADPKAIRLQISGVAPELDADGNLTAAFIQKRPVAYQLAADGSRTPVASRYRRNADGSFSFALGRYDRRRELVIDPTLTFSLYVFGSSQDVVKAIGHDASGLEYVAGITLSTDFEIDPNTMQVPGGPQFPQIDLGLNTGAYDLFIAQIYPNVPVGVNPVGFATYMGGSGDDFLSDMFVAPSGLVYLTGYTKSTDFPQGTVPGYQTTLTGNSDAFVVVYDDTQNVGAQLVYSSYLGGGTGAAGNGITIDSKGRAYIVGTTNSSEVPVVNGLPVGLQGTSDAFVAGFDPTQAGYNSLVYCTFLGGSGVEQGYGITAAPDGTLWVVGETYSTDFPMAGNPYQPNLNGSSDAFITQLNPVTGAQLYTTYLGGSGIDMAQRVKLDATGRVVVTGLTFSGDFPLSASPMQSSYKGMGDVFVAVLNPAATGTMQQLIYSTYYGGSGAESASGLVTDAKGAIYVAGYTGSPDLPITGNALYKQRIGGQNGFVLKLAPSAAGVTGMIYSSFIASTGNQTSYGVDVDPTGTIYVTGSTSGALFDALNGTPKTTPVGKTDGFLMGITIP